MISKLFICMVKYAFGIPVVAMVSHIPVKSRMAVNYVKCLPDTLRDLASYQPLQNRSHHVDGCLVLLSFEVAVQQCTRDISLSCLITQLVNH